MKIRLIIEQAVETGRWSAHFPDLPGCHCVGDTEDEAVDNARAALISWYERYPKEEVPTISIRWRHGAEKTPAPG